MENTRQQDIGVKLKAEPGGLTRLVMTEADGGQRWSDDSHSCITSVQSDRVRLKGYKNARRSMSPF